MEATHDDQEVVMGSHSSSSADDCDAGSHHLTVTKRKRTQRVRGATPVLLLGNSSSTSCLDHDHLSETTEEEEDMAHCLIMLAQGRARSPTPQVEKFTSRKFTETTTTGGGKAGFYVYECKTCNKCFNSFQALGGHRASHKKPKNMTTLQLSRNYDHDDHMDISMKPIMVSPIKVSLPASNKLRIHECSICGAEFSSGQALGGHMRRHRPLNVVAPENQENREIKNVEIKNNVLSLDLNLPAPTDDQNQSGSVAFPRPMVFSSALIDCHY